MNGQLSFAGTGRNGREAIAITEAELATSIDVKFLFSLLLTKAFQAACNAAANITIPKACSDMNGRYQKSVVLSYS